MEFSMDAYKTKKEELEKNKAEAIKEYNFEGRDAADAELLKLEEEKAKFEQLSSTEVSENVEDRIVEQGGTVEELSEKTQEVDAKIEAKKEETEEKAEEIVENDNFEIKEREYTEEEMKKKVDSIISVLKSDNNEYTINSIKKYPQILDPEVIKNKIVAKELFTDYQNHYRAEKEKIEKQIDTQFEGLLDLYKNDSRFKAEDLVKFFSKYVPKNMPGAMQDSRTELDRMIGLLKKDGFDRNNFASLNDLEEKLIKISKHDFPENQFVKTIDELRPKKKEVRNKEWENEHLSTICSFSNDASEIILNPGGLNLNNANRYGGEPGLKAINQNIKMINILISKKVLPDDYLSKAKEIMKQAFLSREPQKDDALYEEKMELLK